MSNSTTNRPTSSVDMITALAHDLRNYMTPVYGNLDRIRRHAMAQEHEKEAQLATGAVRVLDQMLQLLNNVLDLARAEHGLLQLEREPIDLVALVSQMAELLTSDLHAIRVHAPAELYVWGDSARLRQAIHNLFANALNYSPPEAAVDVTVMVVEGRTGDVAQVLVRDYGMGISPELLPLLFKPFHAGPQSTGFGIGLSLASQIINAHGGTIKALAVDGPGACFAWTIPCMSTEQRTELEVRVFRTRAALRDLLRNDECSNSA